MSDRQTALVALRELMVGSVDDPALVLGADAARLAQTLSIAAPDPEGDLEAAYVLGWYHWMRYEELPSDQGGKDLGEAAQYLAPVYRASPELVPEALREYFDDHADEGPWASTNLDSVTSRAIRVMAAYERTGQQDLLLQSIALFEAVVDAMPADDPSPVYLSNLANALHTLFERTGDRSALDQAIARGRQAVAAAPADQAKLAMVLNSLANSLQMQFKRAGEQSVLDEATAVARRAVMAALAVPDGYADYTSLLTNLGGALSAQYRRTGDLPALEEAISVERQAVAAIPEADPSRPLYLHNLGVSLRMLFERTGDPAVLAETVLSQRAALAATPGDHPARAGRAAGLGTTLWLQYTSSGDLSVLDEAIGVEREALAATPEDHPDRVGRSADLGTVLRARFDRTGDLAALDEAVGLGRRALAALPRDHPNRAAALNAVGNALRVLFQHTGELAALEEAVAAARQAVAATPADHLNLPAYSHNLGTRLFILFERTGDPAALEEAMAAIRRAVAATPSEQRNHSMYLNSLGVALEVLFDRTGDPAVLEEAVAVARQAVATASTDRLGRFLYLVNLVGALQKLFDTTKQSTALDEAVAVGRQAVAAAPAEHPVGATALARLGSALRTVFESTGDRTALAEARDCYGAAGANITGDTITRITAYRQSARLAVHAGAAEDGLRCMEAAIELIDMLAPGSLRRSDRQHQLGLLANLAGEAAAAALSAGQPERAVELLEQARGILAADTLGLRGADWARLQEYAPALSRGLEQAGDRLAALDRSGAAPLTDAGSDRTVQQAEQDDRRLADQRREAHADWQRLLGEIRALPGFADFSRAPAVSALTRHAQHGPIVYVTASPTRADALILAGSPSRVEHVPLPGLTLEQAYHHAGRLQSASRAADTRDLAPAEQQSAQEEILDTLRWLWDAVTEPVLGRLGHIDGAGDTPAPRIWWCPVGVLALLPLHAAGHHDLAGAVGRTVPDLVVSSYTTTVRALAHARTVRPDASPATLLVVPVADLPGAELPGVTAEAAAVNALVPGARTLARPTRAAVLEALPTHRAVHFCCHGHADWDDPAASFLVLTDYATTPLTLADVNKLDLDADLAYLSACDTAVTSPRLTDESLHITGAFHLAGYRRVIGTLWPIEDGAAARIAEDFYRHLALDGAAAPRPDLAARALHEAANRLRAQYPQAPSLWAAYTHTGA